MSRVAHISAAGAGAGGGGLTDAELRAAPVVVEGDKTPSDAFANPTDAVAAAGLGMYWDWEDDVWKRWQSRRNTLFIPEGVGESGPPTVSIGGWFDSGLSATVEEVSLTYLPSFPNSYVAGTGFALHTVGGVLLSDGTQLAAMEGTWSDTQSGEHVAAAGLMGYNGVTQSRIRAVPDNADSQTPLATGAILSASRSYVYDGTDWDRARAGAPGADPGNVGIPAVQLHVSDGSNIRRVHSGLGDAASASTMVPSPNWVYNGATWDRMRSGTATGSVLVNNSTAANLLVTATPERASTSALSNVAGSASSVTLLAANAARRGATIVNDSTALLYVKFGTTASTTSYTVRMVADAYYEVPFDYTGRIDGIWASATGNARITELTA